MWDNRLHRNSQSGMQHVIKPRCAVLLAFFAALSLHAQTPPAPLKTGQTAVNRNDDLTYVWIPPGVFTMGCSPGDSECDRDEQPARQVTLTKGFWIGQTDVTQEAYQRVTGTSPGYFKGAKFPVDSVNWDEAQSYCQATGMRLPTEGEWEYAARAGTAAARYGDLGQIAWYGLNSGDKTHEVMQKQPNAWHLYDMLGNVYQWTADWYAPYLPVSNIVGDPRGPASGKIRVLRGGSWGNGPAFVRLSARSGNEPENRSNVVGFRCAANEFPAPR
jgi:formylglycine-generating enzyme required for sulfatase activity